MRRNEVRLGQKVKNKRRPFPIVESGAVPPSLAQASSAAITYTLPNGTVNPALDLTQASSGAINYTLPNGALSYAVNQQYPATIKYTLPNGAVLNGSKPIAIFIDGVDRTDLVLVNTLEIINQLSQATTASFGLWDPAGSMPFPAVGQEVVIYHRTTRIFGGGVEQPVQAAFQANSGHLYAGSGGGSGGGVGSATSTQAGGVHCTDYSYLLLRRYVGAYYATNAFLSNVVQDIINNYLAADGFTFDDSSGDPNIDMGPLLFNWVTIQQAFNTISSNTGWEFTVDYYKVIRFYPGTSGSGPAPFNVADNDGHALAESISLEYFRSMYRNRQGIRTPTQSSFLWQDIFSAAIPGPFPNTPQAPDGIRTNFITKYGILSTPTVLVNGNPQIVISLLEVVGFPGPWDWYWIPQQGFPSPSPGVFQNPSHTPLSHTDVLTVNYSTQLAPIYWVQDDAQIAARAAIEGNTGIYEDVQDAPSTTDPGAIIAYAQGLLDRYGKNGIPFQVGYTTDTDGLVAGMLQNIALANPPIALSGGLVVSVTIHFVDKTIFRYDVLVASNRYQGNWTQFFAALVTASQFAQPSAFSSYTFTIGPTVPGVTNPGALTAGAQPGQRVVTNAVELVQSFTFTLPVAMATDVTINPLVNGAGISGTTFQVVFKAGETGTKTAYATATTANRVFAGDVLEVFLAIAGSPAVGVKDGVGTIITSTSVN